MGRSFSEDSSSGLFRPYLTSNLKSESPETEQDYRRIPEEPKDRSPNVNSSTDIGHKLKLSVNDLVDSHGRFWAHDSCIFWSARFKDRDNDIGDFMKRSISQVRRNRKFSHDSSYIWRIRFDNFGSWIESEKLKFLFS